LPTRIPLEAVAVMAATGPILPTLFPLEAVAARARAFAMGPEGENVRDMWELPIFAPLPECRGVTYIYNMM
jgi:hypothetical protein